MAKHSHTDMVQLTLKVPRGHAGFWSVICEIDPAGPWTQRDVYGRCNADRASIKDFVLRLRSAGFIEQVGVLPNRGPGKADAFQYRLTRRPPLDVPRLDRAGRTLDEPIYATLWRSMKMAKVFTAVELAQLASTDERTVALGVTQQYLRALEDVGIVFRSASLGGRKSSEYRLARDLGPKAPSVMKTLLVFDPNTRTVIGDAVAVEVSK